MSELAETALTDEIMDVEIGRTAEAVNGLLQDCLGFRGALLGQQDGIILREGARRSSETGAS
jgi:hypothetical protein